MLASHPSHAPSPQLRHNDDLFGDLPPRAAKENLGEAAVILGGFAKAAEIDLLQAVAAVVIAAPFRHMTTPGGYRMSVAMSNCGELGWVTDRNGYRYEPIKPKFCPPAAGRAPSSAT